MSCGSKTCTPKRPDAPLLASAAGYFAIPDIAMALRDIAFLCERQKQRRQLLGLDDRLLADIGLTREQAEAEARKPFWR